MAGKDMLLQLLLGAHGGVLGETCAVALILGGIYLIDVYKRQSPRSSSPARVPRSLWWALSTRASCSFPRPSASSWEMCIRDRYSEAKQKLKEYGIVKQNVDSILRTAPGKEHTQER